MPQSTLFAQTRSVRRAMAVLLAIGLITSCRSIWGPEGIHEAYRIVVHTDRTVVTLRDTIGISVVVEPIGFDGVTLEADNFCLLLVSIYQVDVPGQEAKLVRLYPDPTLDCTDTRRRITARQSSPFTVAVRWSPSTGLTGGPPRPLPPGKYELAAVVTDPKVFIAGKEYRGDSEIARVSIIVEEP
jgi:hypothetical protein